MLFFSLAENTNFSAQSRGVAEGTEFTISLFTIMALTFQGNELGGKEHHWVPSDKSAGLTAAANYLAGRKGCVPGIGEGFVNFGEWARRFGVCVMQTGEWPPPGLAWPFPLLHSWADVFGQLRSQTRWKVPLATDSLRGRSNASGIIPCPGQRGRVNKALLCVANRCLC